MPRQVFRGSASEKRKACSPQHEAPGQQPSVTVADDSVYSMARFRLCMSTREPADGGLLAEEEAGVPDILASCRIMRCMLRTPGLSGLKAMLRDGRLSQEDVACLSDIHEAFADLGALVATNGVSGPHGPARRGLMLNDLPDPVLLRTFEFLGGTQSSRHQLNTLITVCRRWKTLAEMDELWKPVCMELWPVLAASPTPRKRPHGGGSGGHTSYRALCKYRARCLRDPGLLIVTPRWPARYRLMFSMTDQMDGLNLFSGEGPMAYQEWHNHQEHRTILRLGAPGAHVVTTPFSAASRDPGLHRFADVRQYFSRSHLPEYPASLCIRLVALDERSGREALLYESPKRTDRHVQDAAQGWPVPPSSLAVTDHAGTWVCAKRGGAACVPPMRSLFDFTIVPAPQGGGEERPALERLYQVHSEQVDPPTNTITHRGIVGLVFLGHVHEVGLLLASLDWL